MMLGIETRNTSHAGGLRKFVEWSVAFAQGNNVLLGLGGGQKFAESPDAAEVEGCR